MRGKREGKGGEREERRRGEVREDKGRAPIEMKAPLTKILNTPLQTLSA